MLPVAALTVRWVTTSKQDMQQVLHSFSFKACLPFPSWKKEYHFQDNVMCLVPVITPWKCPLPSSHIFGYKNTELNSSLEVSMHQWDSEGFCFSPSCLSLHYLGIIQHAGIFACYVIFAFIWLLRHPSLTGLCV